MEGLAPLLHLCIEARMMLERGEAFGAGLRKVLPHLEVNVRQQVMKLLFEFEQRGHVDATYYEIFNPYRRELFYLFEQGLRGEPIRARLIAIEQEIKETCFYEIDAFISGLPLRALLPMLLIQFPSFLLLLFGPLINELTRSFM